MAERLSNLYMAKDNEPTTDKVLAIEIDRIAPNPFQPRKEIADEKIEELAQSIKACGLIQPLVVRRTGDGYQLVVGERRYLACKKLGWQKISATVKTLSDNDMAMIALIENLQRENLSFLEEAEAYLRLIETFKLTQEMLAKRLGKSQSTIANKIRLLKLSGPVQKLLKDYNLSERHARALLKLNSEEEQLKMLNEIAEQGLTVSELEKKIVNKSDPKIKSRHSKKKPVIRDMRIVLNTIRQAVTIMNSSGIEPEVKETIEEDYIEVTIRFSREMVKKNS